MRGGRGSGAYSGEQTSDTQESETSSGEEQPRRPGLRVTRARAARKPVTRTIPAKRRSLKSRGKRPPATARKKPKVRG